jgi:hypothetical protein
MNSAAAAAPGAEELALADLRLDNTLLLFDEFVRDAVRHPDAATLRGLERRFAEHLQIQPSYWSQIKARSRQVGERLARQFERLNHKPHGWLDQPHRSGANRGPVAVAPAIHSTATVTVDAGTGNANEPQDADERFIVALVLGYYRRDPLRARTQLLALLGEALAPGRPGGVAPSARARAGAVHAPESATAGAGVPGAPPSTDAMLWQQVSQGIAPLKRRR